jgi:AAA+ superfamily predicted ATPase
MPSQAQAGQILSLASDCAPQRNKRPFADNLEYLDALEKEALLMLVLAALRAGKKDWPTESTNDSRIYSALGLSASDFDQKKIESELARVRQINKTRQGVSIRSGVKLFFPIFCRENKLDEFDQKILLLLFMNATSEIFRQTFSLCNFYIDKRGIIIHNVLSILCTDYREQLERRKHFSRNAPLVAREIIFFRSDFQNRSSHVMDEIVTTNERHVRYISGDTHLYNSTYSEITIENSAIKLEQVILPGHLKEEMVLYVDKYLRQRASGTASRLDEFLEYGTALTLFFQGPSGTGKTMMAKALAHQFKRPLITVNLNNTHYHWELEHLMVQAFREVSVLNGFIFFDEADDIFKEGTYLARMLLIQIEKARCVVIFATNKAGQMDPAMERRLSMKIHFPLPDAEQRMKIWRALLPDFIKFAPDVDLETLNNRYPFSGGLIKNTIFLAANAAESDGGRHHIITRQLLEQAADYQTQQMMESNQFCKTYLPQKKIDGLPLAEKQRVELKNMVKAFQYSQKNGSGLNLLISGANIETGIHAAEALAAECGIKVKAFNYRDMDTLAKDNELTDTASHEKIKLVDYAYGQATQEVHLLLIIDNNGMIKWSDAGQQNDMDVSLSVKSALATLLNHLSSYRGLCCLVMHECPQTNLPVEFHAHFKPEYPPEERQMQYWERYLAQGSVQEGDLVELVERHPMHIAEIDSILHRSSIQSLIEGNPPQPSLETIKKIIERYRGKGSAPVLFGRKVLCDGRDVKPMQFGADYRG